MIEDRVAESVRATASYLRALARDERAFAEDDRARRCASFESIRLHERRAQDFERRAYALELLLGDERPS